MDVGYAPQYGTPCITVEPGDSAEGVIAEAEDQGAVFNDGEDLCFVVQLPDRPQELYTERALRASLTA